ncbi:MAG: hypothetical protein M1296_05470 [Chloroflexi bacterium]|nr:hypothetical protein [Chloroflexota bacterium]
MWRSRVLFALLFASIISLAACSQSATGSTPPQFIEASRLKNYHSLQELNSEAVAVARVTATNTRSVEPIGTIPYTVTVVRVDQFLRGSVNGPSIKLRQMGSLSGNVRLTDSAPLVQSGSSYVVFLQRFTFGPGRDTDQYIPVGGSPGLYLDQNGTLKRLDPESPDLPATLSEAELQQQIVTK